MPSKEGKDVVLTVSPLQEHGPLSAEGTLASPRGPTIAEQVKAAQLARAAGSLNVAATLTPVKEHEDTQRQGSPVMKKPGKASARRNRRRQREFSGLDRLAHARESLSMLFSTGQIPKSRRQALELEFESLLKSNGLEFALKALKSWSGSCRGNWILKSGSEADAQGSFLGRSLPKGTVEQGKETLKTHRLDYLSAASTEDCILKRARRFSQWFAKRFLGDPCKMASPGLANNSSCSERTIRKGGLLGLAVELGIHPEAVEAATEKLRGFPQQDVNAVARDLSLSFHGLDMIEAGQVLPSTPVALQERGLKIRVITKSSAPMHFLGHSVRKRLLAGLRAMRSSGLALAGLKDEELFDHLDGASASTVVSSDLTRATDLLPLDLVASIVDGLEASGKVPPEEISVLRLLCGPQIVDWGRGAETTSRGILMGLPCSWSVLSIIHHFWWSDSIRQAALARSCPLKEAYRRNRYAICGDDAIFCGWTEVKDCYEDLVRRCRGEFSAGKHYVVSSISGVQLRGVFLERLYTFGTDGNGRIAKSGCFRSRSIPLRGLVRPEIPPQFRSCGSSLRVTKVVKYLFSIDSVWSSHPGSAPILCQVVSNNPWLREATSRIGLLDGIHLAQGGSGLPISSPSRAALEQRYRVAIAPEDLNVVSLMRGIVDSNWSMADAMVGPDLAMFVEDGTLVFRPQGEEAPGESLGAPYVNAGELSDFTTRVQVESYSDLLYMLGQGQPYRAKLTEKMMAHSVKEWVANLPSLPEGADLANPPARIPTVVWVRRTWSTEGRLLFPRWVGETKASEAAARYSIFADRARRNGC